MFAGEKGLCAAKIPFSAANKGLYAAKKGIFVLNMGLCVAIKDLFAVDKGLCVPDMGMFAAEKGLFGANNGQDVARMVSSVGRAQTFLRAIGWWTRAGTRFSAEGPPCIGNNIRCPVYVQGEVQRNNVALRGNNRVLQQNQVPAAGLPNPVAK